MVQSSPPAHTFMRDWDECGRAVLKLIPRYRHDEFLAWVKSDAVLGAAYERDPFDVIDRFFSR